MAAIVNAYAHRRSYLILVDDVADLRYSRAGEHFHAFLDRPEAVIIIDILHSWSDLPGHIEALAALKGKTG